MKILVPQGIGDAIWALMKVQSLAKASNADRIEICMNCNDPNDFVQCRSLEFVSRFKFVDHAYMLNTPIVMPGPVADKDGYFRYVASGKNKHPEVDWVLVPNSPLERGIRLEKWYPEYETNFKIMNEWTFKDEEISYAEKVKEQIGDYVVFYMASLPANTVNGHNRGAIWKPQDWIDLGNWVIEELGLSILTVGSVWDRSYFNVCIDPLIDRNKSKWASVVGMTGIGQTYALIKEAKFSISYQSGIGIVGNYLGVPTGIFWRAKGDSIFVDNYVSFEESMASAWADPDAISSGKHMPLIYGRHNVNYIKNQVIERKWHC